MHDDTSAATRPGAWTPPWRPDRVLPVLSGVLLVLSFPPLHLLVPPFVALVPFGLWVHGLPRGREGARAAFRGGALLGTVYFGFLLYWILIALIAYTVLALLAWVAVLGILVLLTALSGWILHRLIHGAGVALWLALPLAWTSAEWMQGALGDLSFPWLGLGTSLTGFPQLVGVAELVGARGVTFWIALSNGILATAILHRRGARRAVPAAAFALVVLLPMAWGVWRAATLEMRAVGEVAVVQPNIPPEVKLDRDEATDSTMRALEALMPRLHAPVTLVVWPEVTLPEVVRAPEQESLRERVRALAAAAGSDILLGGYGFRAAARRSAGGGGAGTTAGRNHSPGEEGERGPTIYNSAFVMTPAGLSGFEYSKRDLVPIIERVPFANPDWFPDRRYYGSLGRGDVGVREPARAGGVAFGVLICYESIFAESSRAFRRAGADVLLNITNDAWYGRDVWYGRTTALWQHPAHMVMRAIENRVGVARAANTGISLFIDPVGRVYGRAPLFEPALGQEVVYTTDGLTLYARLGDVTGRGALFSTLLLLFHAGRRGRRPVASGAQAGHDT